MFCRVCVSGLYAALVSRPVGACGAARGPSGVPRLAGSRAPSDGPLSCASCKGLASALHQPLFTRPSTREPVAAASSGRERIFSPPGFFTCPLKPHATVCQPPARTNFPLTTFHYFFDFIDFLNLRFSTGGPLCSL